MKYLIPLFSLILIFSVLSCETVKKEGAEIPSVETPRKDDIAPLMFDLSPREGKLYFFALVTREQYRDNEIESCRAEAARQLSRYFQINGVSYSKTSESVNGLSLMEATGIAFNDDLALNLQDKLKLEKKVKNYEWTAALFSYKAERTFSLPYKPTLLNSRPDWINSSARIPGYQTAVGFTGKKRFLERGIQQADKNALATLLEQRKGSLNITQADWQNEHSSAAASLSVEKSAGSVKQAYILSRWIDPEGNVYSLAVCPRK